MHSINKCEYLQHKIWYMVYVPTNNVCTMLYIYTYLSLDLDTPPLFPPLCPGTGIHTGCGCIHAWSSQRKSVWGPLGSADPACHSRNSSYLCSVILVNAFFKCSFQRKWGTIYWRNEFHINNFKNCAMPNVAKRPPFWGWEDDQVQKMHPLQV